MNSQKILSEGCHKEFGIKERQKEQIYHTETMDTVVSELFHAIDQSRVLGRRPSISGTINAEKVNKDKSGLGNIIGYLDRFVQALTL